MSSDVYGDDLVRLRKAAGKTQQQMADYVGVSLNTVKSWEKDITEPKVNQYIKWCACCSQHAGEHLSEAIARRNPWEVLKLKLGFRPR